ncbi:MAG: flavodoxin domain-containing protein [Acidimicrobiales bacterium]
MAILVTYGSTRGGTQGLAEMIGDELRKCGFEVDVSPASAVGRRLAGYDAVVVGGALYMGRWHKDARRFVKSHVLQLYERPTFFFSSGPLGSKAQASKIPPTRSVQRLMKRVATTRHATFGGRLDEGAHGYMAASMAKSTSGDFRDEANVRTWARHVADELQHPRAA